MFLLHLLSGKVDGLIEVSRIAQMKKEKYLVGWCLKYVIKVKPIRYAEGHLSDYMPHTVNIELCREMHL